MKFAHPPESSTEVHTISTEELLKLFEIAYALKKAIDSNDHEKIKALEHNRSLLKSLLDYLKSDATRSNLYQSLIAFLEEFFGMNKELEKEKRKEQHDLEEEKLSKAERERRYRLIIYEIHKMLNPQQLAGETELQNFISNILTHGTHVAIKYAKPELIEHFTKKDLKILESYKHKVVNTLHQHGFSGGKPRLRSIDLA